jgi:hypothetical protein
MDDALLEDLGGNGHDASSIGAGTFRVDVPDTETRSLETLGSEIARDLVEQRGAWQVLDPELAMLDDLEVNCDYRTVPDERAVILTLLIA